MEKSFGIFDLTPILRFSDVPMVSGFLSFTAMSSVTFTAIVHRDTDGDGIFDAVVTQSRLSNVSRLTRKSSSFPISTWDVI